MRIGGATRGVFAGFLGLIALQALGSNGGSGRVASAFADLSGLIERVLDPDVPAIPDRRAGAAIQPGNTVRNAAAAAVSPDVLDRLPLPSPPK